MADKYEIVERLRSYDALRNAPHHLAEAASTIMELAEALEPFAKHADYLNSQNLDGHVIHTGPFTFDDFLRVMNALSRLKGTDHAG